MKFTRLAGILMMLVSAFTPTATGQQTRMANNILAEVGTKKITLDEFRLRVSLAQLPENNSRAAEKEALERHAYAFAAEKLLAMAAADAGIGSDVFSGYMRSTLLKALVRGELHQQEVVRKIQISPKSVEDAYLRFMYNLKLVGYLFRDKETAEEFRIAVAKARDKKAAADSFSRLRILTVDTLRVMFGGPDLDFEEAAYGINHERVSRPVVVPGRGWGVLMEVTREINPRFAARTHEQRLEAVRAILWQREERRLTEQLTVGAMGLYRPINDSTLWLEFGRTLRSLMRTDSLTRYRANLRLFTVRQEDIDLMFRLLEEKLQLPLIRMASGDLSVGDVLEWYRYHAFGFTSLEPIRFFFELAGQFNDIAAAEVIYREGKRRGFAEKPNVRTEYEMWDDHFLSRMFIRLRIDTAQLNDDIFRGALVRYGREFGTGYSVRIQELLSSELSKSLSLLDSLAAGAEFEGLIQRHTKRLAWKSADGVSGWLPVRDYPELGFTALLADTNLVNGPVRIPEGYSLFRTIDKRVEPARAKFLSLDSLRLEIVMRVQRELRDGLLSEALESASKKHPVRMHPERLAGFRRDMSQESLRNSMIPVGDPVAIAPLPSATWIDNLRMAQKKR